MKDNDIDCYPLYCTGKSYTSFNKAWDRFDDNLKSIFKWIRGYKYWRVCPIENKTIDFEANKAEYNVYARISCLDKQVKGLKRVSLKKPYPKDTKLKDIPFHIGRVNDSK